LQSLRSFEEKYRNTFKENFQFCAWASELWNYHFQLKG
jgi:hypothetical protein